jgi:outer membrane protein
MRVNIEQAYADAVAALKRYRASEKSVSSLEESFKYSRIRYEEKMINSVDFNDAKNKLAVAQSNLVQAKYDFIFKTKILDFYQGKALSL